MSDRGVPWVVGASKLSWILSVLVEALLDVKVWVARSRREKEAISITHNILFFHWVTGRAESLELFICSITSSWTIISSLFKLALLGRKQANILDSVSERHELMRIEYFVCELFSIRNLTIRSSWSTCVCFYSWLDNFYLFLGWVFFRNRALTLLFLLIVVDHLSNHLFNFNTLLELIIHVQFLVLVGVLVFQIIHLLSCVLLVF